VNAKVLPDPKDLLYGIGFEWVEWTDKHQMHRPTPCHCSFCNLYQPVYVGLCCCRCRSQRNMRPLIEFSYRGDVLFARINPVYEGKLDNPVKDSAPPGHSPSPTGRA